MSTKVSADGSMMKTSAGIFLESLKHQTTQQHKALESQQLLAALMSPEVTKQQYCHYLLLMQQIERTYEEKVLPVVQYLFPSHFYQKSSGVIQQDLLAIGGTPSPEDVVSTFEIPGIKISTPFALGFTYVMEGSKLGGRVIYKHINKTLEFSENNGAQFLADTGADTGRKWKEFLSILATIVTESKKEQEVIQGAQVAFTSIYDYFESNS